MGKSSKKKKRLERERLERLQNAVLSGSAAKKPQLQPLDSEMRDDDNDSRSTSSARPLDQTTPKIIESSTVLPSKKNLSSDAFSSREKAFGSTASRTRTLPTVSFVFPKDSNSTPLPYEFNKKWATNESNHGANTSTAHGNESPKSNRNQSIDEIFLSAKSRIHDTDGRELDNGIHENRILHRSSSDGKLNNQPTNETTTPDTRRRSSSLSEMSRSQSNASPASPISPYLSGVTVEEAIRDRVGLRPRSNSTDGELKLPQRGLCDERKVLETYQWDSNTFCCNAPPKGFHNLGNTCFLNSTLQCLAYCPPFCQSIITLSQEGSITATSMIAPTAGKSKTKLNPKHDAGNNHGKRMTMMLGALFRQVHSLKSNHQKSGSSVDGKPISPSSIVRAVPTLGSHRKSGYKFRPGRQEDVHEFLVHLLDAMNDGELREAGINAQKSGWRDRLPVPRLDETTFVHRIFGGYLRSQVRCTECGYTSNTYDPFLDLSLEISRKSCHSVSSALMEFTRKETLDSANRWKCSGCKRRVCATKQLTVFRPPLSLCIQLKRFSYGGSHGSFGGRMGGKKIAKPIEFPATLTLSLSDGRSCCYELTGIVIHVGGTASSGHYTAYVKKPTKNGGDKWYHMDDSFAQSVTERDVLRQRDAYMLMYCRKEVKIEFPTPPLRVSMTTEEAKVFNRSRARSREVDSNETLPLSSAISPTSAEDGKYSNAMSIETEKVATSTFDSTIRLGLPPAISASSPPSLDRDCGDFPLISIQNDTADGRNSSPSEESQSSSSDSEAVDDGENLSRHSIDSTPCTIPVVSNGSGQPSISRISLDRGEGGKIEVMMGPRYKTHKAWQPKTTDGPKDEGYDLLGNIRVSKWNDDEVDASLPNGKSDTNNNAQMETMRVREKVNKQIVRRENDRKRRMFLDRHDALLDQGKVSSCRFLWRSLSS